MQASFTPVFFIHLHFTVKSVCSCITHALYFPAGLINTFSGYGPLTVEWPGKDGKHPRCPPKGNVAKGNDKAGRLTFFLPGVLRWHMSMLVSF